MYHIYTTKAFIVKSLPQGETNRVYFLFTEDLGFIRSTAQGVRLGKSKLKGHLQDYSFTRVSLVKGKEIWRIVSAEVILQIPFHKDVQKMSVIKNVFSLLIRLLHGEEKNEALFLTLENAYQFLLAPEKQTQETFRNLETLIVLRILFDLGYFKKTEITTKLIDIRDFSFEILNMIETQRVSIIRDINTALAETHL